jgi:hypothetical protein
MEYAAMQFIVPIETVIADKSVAVHRVATVERKGHWIERQRERVWKLGPFGKFSMAVWIATMVIRRSFHPNLACHATRGQ